MSLSQETIRIRHQVKEWSRSGRKQWDLYRYLYNPYVIYDALTLVIKNGGASGVDGKTIKDIKGKEWEMVQLIITELQAGTFKPGAVRRVYIPKKEGTQRPLGIPNLIDRTLQRAIVLLMEPIYELRFHSFSFGFRPKRRAVDCAAEVANQCYKLRYVLDADIEKFFDNVEHKKLLGVIRREIVDSRVLKLILGFLKSGFCEPGKPWQATRRGTPQGGPLSPLLANIYLHYFLDNKFNEVYAKYSWIKLIRYADDFVILLSQPGQQRVVQRFVTLWLREAGLNLKASKTRWVDMTNQNRSYESKFDFLGFKFHLRSFKDNPQRFWIARQPSEKARLTLREAIRERLHVGIALEEAQKRIVQTWLGWCNYFRYSNANRIFLREASKVRRIINWWLARKFRRQRKAVPWRIILTWGKNLGKAIKPIKVIPNHLSERRTQAPLFM